MLAFPSAIRIFSSVSRTTHSELAVLLLFLRRGGLFCIGVPVGTGCTLGCACGVRFVVDAANIEDLLEAIEDFEPLRN